MLLIAATKLDETTMIDHDQPEPAATEAEAPRQLTPAAQRALAEAQERRDRLEAERAAIAAAAAGKPVELGGRAGPDPVRYGDWENGGIASDF